MALKVSRTSLFLSGISLGPSETLGKHCLIHCGLAGHGIKVVASSDRLQCTV